MLEQVSDDLANHGLKFYSQGDEDGVIAEIFRRVGTTSKTFIEFGAAGGWENNTRLLLEQGWRGLWIEANPKHAGRIRRAFRGTIGAGRLTIIEAFVTAENINRIILSCGFPAEIDFLSIDIDGNDYHVFNAITATRPRVVCIECSVSKPPPVDWVMPYNPSHRWNGRDDCAASLVAMDRLAKSKGYVLVGTTAHSTNAFFVRTDLIAGHFSGPFSAERFFRPVTYEDIVTYPRTMPPILSKSGFQVRLIALKSRLRLRTRASALVRGFVGCSRPST